MQLGLRFPILFHSLVMPGVSIITSAAINGIQTELELSRIRFWADRMLAGAEECPLSVQAGCFEAPASCGAQFRDTL